MNPLDPLGLLGNRPQVVVSPGIPIGPALQPIPVTLSQPPSGITPVVVTNPTPVNFPSSIGTSGVTPQLVTVTNPGSVSVPTPLQVSGIVGVSPLPLPTSGVTPQLVTVTNPSAVNIPTPLQVSGIVGVSPLPLPISGVTPQLVTPTQLPSGILPVSITSTIPLPVSISQPLQVSGIVGVSPLPLPVSGVTPQLVAETRIPLPTTLTGIPTVSGVLANTAALQAQRFNIVISAGGNLLTGPLSPNSPPCLFRGLFAFNVSGVLSLKRTVAGVTISEQFNGGQPLASGAAYMFDSLVIGTDSINYQYSSGGVMTVIRVLEIDAQT